MPQTQLLRLLVPFALAASCSSGRPPGISPTCKLLLSGSPDHACVQGTTPTNPKQPGTHRRRSVPIATATRKYVSTRKRKSFAQRAEEQLFASVRFESTWVRCRRTGGCKPAAARGALFQALGVSGYSASSGRCGLARGEMDTPPLSGSDSDSDDSLVTDREVGIIRARGAARGRGFLTLPFLPRNVPCSCRRRFPEGF